MRRQYYDYNFLQINQIRIGPGLNILRARKYLYCKDSKTINFMKENDIPSKIISTRCDSSQRFVLYWNWTRGQLYF